MAQNCGVNLAHIVVMVLDNCVLSIFFNILLKVENFQSRLYDKKREDTHIQYSGGEKEWKKRKRDEKEKLDERKVAREN